jgi:biotin operon repressor
MTKLSAKQKMLNTLQKTEGYNTFTVEQARHRFGVQNVSARIEELRKEGYCIYTNTKTLENGSKVNYYRMGKPSREMIKAAALFASDTFYA